jgi:hypothetical protein
MSRRKLDLTIPEDAGLPALVYRAIANAQLSHHPFKRGSDDSDELIQALPVIRRLSADQYELCVAELLKLLDAIENHGCNCFARGLVYFRHLTWGRDRETFSNMTERLQLIIDSLYQRHGSEAEDYEQTFADSLLRLGVSSVPEYVPLVQIGRAHV